MTRKISTSIAILIILILSVVVGAGAWWYGQKNQPEDLVLNQPIQKNQKSDNAVDQKTYQDKKERTILLKVETSGGYQKNDS